MVGLLGWVLVSGACLCFMVNAGFLGVVGFERVFRFLISGWAAIWFLGGCFWVLVWRFGCALLAFGLMLVLAGL